MSGKHSCDERMGGKTMAREKREVEIKSRADTLPLTSPEVRPWPVTPPPPPEEVTKVYEKRKAGEVGKARGEPFGEAAPLGERRVPPPRKGAREEVGPRLHRQNDQKFPQTPQHRARG